MILVDSSVWIDFFAGKIGPGSDLVRKAIENKEDICVCGVIMTEVLQGIRSDKEFKRVDEILSDLVYLPITKDIFIKAAKIYRMLRKQGKTVRSPVDCMIASVCLEHDVRLLHHDRDFEVIGAFFPLQIVS